MDQTWFLAIRTPAPSTELWDVSDAVIGDRIAAYLALHPDWSQQDAEATARGDYVTGALAELGAPTPWYETPGWDAALIEGQPHPKLVAVANVHPQLPALPPIS